MTLHNAKGLEFDAVFLVGLEDGIFPHSRAIDSGELDEERRLCYVGITRARRHLAITWARRRALYGPPQTQVPSRFLRELPHDALDEASPEALSGRPGAGGPTRPRADFSRIGRMGAPRGGGSGGAAGRPAWPGWGCGAAATCRPTGRRRPRTRRRGPRASGSATSSSARARSPAWTATSSSCASAGPARSG